ncbi:dihydropteroate synthase [Marinomonas balearica]|nr:dihydropteroate synthase [Marinomonas balearica]
MSVVSFGGKQLDLTRPHVMGILNVTPDSFSDGGKFNTLDVALSRVEEMLNEGASFIDVGGESTRPGATPVSLQEELDRVVPVVEAITSRFDTVVSVDTSAPEVMRLACGEGAGLINDVRALERDGAVEAAVELGVPVCLMHMKGTPESMQHAPVYDSAFDDVVDYLENRAAIVERLGVNKADIFLDPGIGFGKKLQHNLTLLNRLDGLKKRGYEVLIGASRKTLIGDVLNLDVGERLYGSMGVHAAAYSKGSRIFRVHDVRPHVEMLEMMYRIERER